MGHLIRTLVGDADLNRLPAAYDVLAEAYLACRAGKLVDCKDAINSFSALRDSVLASEAKVPVGKLCRPKCDLVDTDEERPAELFNNLGQIEMLIGAIRIMREAGLSPTKSAPTQQSKDNGLN